MEEVGMFGLKLELPELRRSTCSAWNSGCQNSGGWNARPKLKEDRSGECGMLGPYPTQQGRRG